MMFLNWYLLIEATQGFFEIDVLLRWISALFKVVACVDLLFSLINSLP